ncbi:hypothetical protein [Undibacter mobilis]|uniref:Uncharacterized protein n=1 Tax=Undibacter mobilis TaxID=2292256 RepID=A0A371B3N1_9BRAD|nr:hypothetical protein [Undibacter mobilis]RDV02196.1 hypothetical protein DXH78_16530 [Undibacter mobilis]
MQRFQKFIAAYFIVIGMLALIAIIPGGTLLMLIVTMMGLPLFGIPGLLTAAAPTIFIYSTAAFAVFVAATEPKRNYVAISIVVLAAIALAVGPGLKTRWDVKNFADKVSANDIIGNAKSKPKTIELIGDISSGLYKYGEEVGDKRAPCPEICRRLLFGGEVEWVRMTSVPQVDAGRRHGPTFQVDYRLEHRESCPQLYPTGTDIDKAVRDRVAGGDCIVMDVAGAAKPDVTMSFLTLYRKQEHPRRPVTDRPSTIESVKELRVEESSSPTPVLIRTQTTANPIALPFYIGSEFHMQGGYNGPVLGRVEITHNSSDMALILRETFGFIVAPIQPFSKDDVAKLTDRILSLPPDTNPALSSQQQQVLADDLKDRVRKFRLTSADIDFVMRILQDSRISELPIGAAIQGAIRDEPARFTLAIPLMLDRIETPALQSTGQYRGALAWSLLAFPAEALRPHREQILRILDNEQNGTTGPLLARVGELGISDATARIEEQLKSKSSDVRRFAALAVCRAGVDAWATLEPIALAHLAESKPSDKLHDDDRKLILALVRFGKKTLALEALARLLTRDQDNAQKRLDTFEANFTPNRCRDFL